jgi:hypothetical protein
MQQRQCNNGCNNGCMALMMAMQQRWMQPRQSHLVSVLPDGQGNRGDSVNHRSLCVSGHFSSSSSRVARQVCLVHPRDRVWQYVSRAERHQPRAASRQARLPETRSLPSSGAMERTVQWPALLPTDRSASNRSARPARPRPPTASLTMIAHVPSLPTAREAVRFALPSSVSGCKPAPSETSHAAFLTAGPRRGVLDPPPRTP